MSHQLLVVNGILGASISSGSQAENPYQNLIVADDSIVPVNMDGSPMATAYLIAANIANMMPGK